LEAAEELGRLLRDISLPNPSKYYLYPALSPAMASGLRLMSRLLRESIRLLRLPGKDALIFFSTWQELGRQMPSRQHIHFQVALMMTLQEF
jgi:hypothetical protein